MFSLLVSGRNGNASMQDRRNYALINGPGGHMANMNGGGMRPPTCGAENSGNGPPTWIMQGMANRRSLGSESDGPNDRCVQVVASIKLCLTLKMLF